MPYMQVSAMHTDSHIHMYKDIVTDVHSGMTYCLAEHSQHIFPCPIHQKYITFTYVNSQYDILVFSLVAVFQESDHNASIDLYGTPATMSLPSVSIQLLYHVTCMRANTLCTAVIL